MVSSGLESDAEPMSIYMLEDILDSSQSHTIINRREAHYNIHDQIKQGQAEWKGALLPTKNMGEVLHKVFEDVVNEILQALPIQGESGSEVSYLIPEPRKFSEVTELSEDIRKPWIKTTLKDIKNLINNQDFLVQDKQKDKPLNTCMNVYRAKLNLMEVLKN